MSLGELVKNRRKELNLTQGELAKDLCTQAMISKIERNLLNPSSKMLGKLGKRLQVPVSYFYNEGVPTDSRLEELEELIRSHLNKTEYDNINYLIESNQELFIKAPSLYFQTFFSWIKAVLTYYKQKDTDKAITILEELHTNNELPTKLSIDVLTTLAVIYYENSKHDKANSYFKIALDQWDSAVAYKKKVKVIYNHSLNLESLNKQKEALEMVLEGIEILIANQSFYMLGYLYFHKAYLLRNFGETRESIEAYENASFVFKILGYDKMLTMTRIELKEVKELKKH